MLYFGVPTSLALGSVLAEKVFLNNTSLSDKVDENFENGYLYVLPITLLRKDECRRMVEIIQKVAAGYFFDPAITLNPIKADIIEAVVSLSFKTSDKNLAHECVRKIQQELLKAGHMLYRTNIKDMDLFFEDKEYNKILQGIKKVFDPRGIIAAGRYMGGIEEEKF